MAGHRLAFTSPFMSTGFVLVTQGAAKGAKTMDDVQARGLKIGVPAYTPMHEYVQANGFEYMSFFQNYQVIDALVRGEVDAAMIWSGAISQAKLEHPEAEFELAEGLRPGTRHALEQRLGGQGEGDGVEAVHRRGVRGDAQERRDQAHRRAIRDAVLSAVRATRRRQDYHDR